MKVALVYDRLNKVGGAEQVLCAFHELFPHADWYTSVWDRERAPFSASWNVHASWLNRFSVARRHHEWFPFLMPFIFESFDFTGYDLVISIGSAECKGIVTRPETVHIYYCLTPTRYLYSHASQYLGQWYQRVVAKYLRAWDQVAATRPDIVISISNLVKNRVKKYYNRNSDVIYPPVDVAKFSARTPGHQIAKPPDNYYVIVSRLVPYKNIDIAVSAFNESGRKLVIVGAGSEESRLRKMAKNNITFSGFVTEDKVMDYYRNCRGFIQCNEEDFGIAMVEAQAAGKPVIAYSRGGAAEIVTEATGVLYNEISVDSLNNAVDRVESATYEAEACRKNALRFAKVTWMRMMKERIDTYVKK